MNLKLVFSMKIINYGHACFKILNSTVSVIIDPYRDDSVPGLEPLQYLKANYVFKSHDHFDHDATFKVKLEPTDNKLDVIKVNLPHDKVGGAKRGMSVAHIFKLDGLSICHMGDIGDPEVVKRHEELKDLDIVLCPINGFFTISALEAIELKKAMSWKLLIPMHYEKKDEGSGYPDGGQIDIFLKNMPNHKYVDDELDIDESIFGYDSLIFKTHRKGE